MRRNPPRILLSTWLFLVALLATCPALAAEPSVKETMDGIVTRLYADLDEDALGSLNDESIMKLITDEERAVLATKYWCFDVNVPVIVSVMRNPEQQVIPFWLGESGFAKTDLTVRNDMWTFEVWQKRFEAGRVELGINGFDIHRSAYFVCVGPAQAGDKLTVTNIFPENTAAIEMKKGAWTYRDWDDLYLDEVPDSLRGQVLLTTYRGRAREAHLIGAFRKTPYPSSAKPDHVVLTWSEDPRTTQTVQWRTNTEVKSGVVRYRRKGTEDVAYTEVTARTELIEDRLLMNDRFIHQHTAVLRELEPATEYVYSAGSPDINEWIAETSFTTAPDGDAPFSFVYFGDAHSSEHWGRLLHTAHERHPETAFYTIAGDLVRTGLYRDDWDMLYEYSEGVFDRKPLAFSLGNHDDQDGLGAGMALALAEFPKNGPAGEPAESNYSFRYGNTLFLVMGVGTHYDIQAKWIEQQLADTDATWKIGIFHFPLYSSKEDDEYQAIRDSWEGIFEKHGLDMMLHGHVHYYVRTHPIRDQKTVDSPADGTTYVTSVSIPGRESEREVEDYAAKYMNTGPWYQVFDIDGRKLVYRVHDAEGKVCDELIIRK